MKIGNEEFWTELNELGNLAEGAWCVGGDFNHRGMESMNGFLIGLIDIPLQNASFTWSNFRENAACSRLDKISISDQWLDKFSGIFVRCLPRLVWD